MNDFTTIPDYGLSWLEASGDHADIVLSTRVRLARNLQGHAFGPRARVNDREAVLSLFKTSVERAETLTSGTLLEMPDVATRTRRILLERRWGRKTCSGRKRAVLRGGRRSIFRVVIPSV